MNINIKIVLYSFYVLITIQIINIYSALLETGTQGSIDGYKISVLFGVIIFIITFILYFILNTVKKSRFLLILFFVQTIILYLIHFPYIKYVVFQKFTINDVITDVIKWGAFSEQKNKFEIFLPILMYMYITQIGYISIKEIYKYYKDRSIK